MDIHKWICEQQVAQQNLLLYILETPVVVVSHMWRSNIGLLLTAILRYYCYVYIPHTLHMCVCAFSPRGWLWEIAETCWSCFPCVDKQTLLCSLLGINSFVQLIDFYFACYICCMLSCDGSDLSLTPACPSEHCSPCCWVRLKLSIF